MKIHFIAIGGSAMHNLAIALHKKGYRVSGSDDAFFEPSKSRLDKYGLLPEKSGWDDNRITAELDAVILGMHAKTDNPELKKAQQLGLNIYSYPEYVYQQSKDKTRVVIGGSHGKTTTTAMILHVLHYHKKQFDYLVGAQLDGFETMVKLSDAPVIILEGDEYLSSPIDRRPKFHLYKGHIGLITGIAWDHINVFPTYEVYEEQFREFVRRIPMEGKVIFFGEDEKLSKVVNEAGTGAEKIPYTTPDHEIKEGNTYLLSGHGAIPLQVFGAHNLQNMEGARMVCEQLGINERQFYKAIQSFAGASRRLELISRNENTIVFKDFAHSPSKLEATTRAVKAQYPERELIACIELHTFSSLDAGFLKEYQGAMDDADKAIVYFNPETIAHKKLPAVTGEQVKNAFQRKDLAIFNDSKILQESLKSINWNNKVLLIMTSGNFDGIDIDVLGKEITTVDGG